MCTVNAIDQTLKSATANRKERLENEKLDKAIKALELDTTIIAEQLRRKVELEDLQRTLPQRQRINKKYTKHLQAEAVKLAKQITNSGATQKPIYGIDQDGTIQVVLPKLYAAKAFGLSRSWLGQVLTNKASTSVYANLFWTRNPSTPKDVIEAHFNRYHSLHGNTDQTWEQLVRVKYDKDNDIFPDC